MRITPFMTELYDKFLNEKKVKENTAKNYIRNLYIANRNKPYNNLAFLKKYGDVDVAISPYKLSTQNNIIIAVVSALSLYTAKPSYRKVHQYWNTRLHKLNDELKKNANKMSEKQKENYLPWSEIESIRDDLKQDVNHFKDNKKISARQFSTLKKYVVMSLYTYIPPRRNRDYQDCYIVWGERNRDDDRNYFDAKNHKFIFNQYKTNKKYGQQIVDFSDKPRLIEALDLWIKFHPLLKGKRLSRNTNTRLLVNYDGSPMDNVNSITRVLYSAIGKKIGSSMLRHIYLSKKYNNTLEDMRNDAKALGHSLAQQKGYIFEDAPNESIENEGEDE